MKALTISDFAKDFDKTPRKNYRKIAVHFLRLLSIAIVREAFVCYLPYGLGSIFVTRKKQKTTAIDLNAYSKHKVIVPFRNLHTSGYVYRFKWSRKESSLNGKYYYKFSAVKDDVKRELGKRGLAEWIKYCDNNHIKYTTLEG